MTWKHNIPKLMGCSNRVTKMEFLAVNATLKKKKGIKNDLLVYLKLEKEQSLILTEGNNKD